MNLMVQFQRDHLDAAFVALADSTRRGVLERLGQSDASITELAERFHMTLTGMKKHVAVLERAGLVVTRKEGRVRTCRLGGRGLGAEAEWIEAHRKLFEARFDALGNEVSGLGPAEFGACVRAEVSRWAEIVRHYVRSSGLAMYTRSKPFSLTRPVS